MNNVLSHDISLWKDPSFITKAVQALSYFIFALIVSHYAAYFATQNAGPHLPDIILDNLPLVNMTYIHYFFVDIVKYIVLLFLLVKPKYFVFTFKSIATLVLVRSFFVCLTQLGIPSGNMPLQTFYTMGGDLFFSGHVAMPFLLGLIFWDNKPLRYISFLMSLFFACEVLLGKFHYSIDVFAAPFIAYSVYEFCRYLFRNDYELINDN